MLIALRFFSDLNPQNKLDTEYLKNDEKFCSHEDK